MARNKSFRSESLTANVDKTGTFNNHYSKQVLKLLDSINIKIISELVKNPNINSLTLSKKSSAFHSLQYKEEEQELKK